MHVSAALAEWVLGLCFLAEILTLVPEFYRASGQLTVTLPEICGRQDDKVSQLGKVLLES